MRIIPASEAGDVRDEISRVFVEGFYPLLKMLCKDKRRLTKALAHMFRTEQYFVAMDGGRVAAIAARADGKTSSLCLNKAQLRRHLGLWRGSLAWLTMHKEVDFPKYPFPIESGMCAIENVAVDPEYRRQGLARRLLAHIIETAPGGTCVLEVADNNKNARALYESLGFREVARLKQKYTGFTGVGAYLYLRMEKKADVRV
ncbi:MAG: GNAT family N-acetyltransferase [Oscillospiraceae bacterium]|nr:GNAT family N-acetyltransferase [Oscillospiraceae bacterium]